MKLVSTRTELALVRAGAHPDPSVSGTVLSGIDESYFYNDFTQEMYNRIQELVRERGEVPSWRNLLADPEISEETRDKLSKTEIPRLKTRAEALSSIRILNKYRQLRGLYELSSSINTQLKKEKVAVHEVLDSVTNDLGKLRQVRSDDAIIVKFGKGNNSTALVKSLINKEEESDFIPTGFSEFDDKNGGFGFGNLIVLGGSSGAGKSTLAAQLGINWSSMGEHVVMVPLEMTEREMTARVMANAAGLDVRKILHQKLTDNEKELYLKSYSKFVRTRKKEGGTLSFFKPKSDMTIEEILACTYTMGPRIVIVDYISLLKGVDGDDAWQKLGAVARYCKIYAEVHHIIVVMLCQVSEEGKIRYAQAIKEHANYCLDADSFVATQTGLVRIADMPSTRTTLEKEVGSWSARNRVLSENKVHTSTAWHSNGVKEVYELRTQNGYTVKTTAEHKFLTLSPYTLQRKWRKLSELTIDDYIATSLLLPSNDWPKKEWKLEHPKHDLHHNAKTLKLPRRLTPDLAYLVGTLLADGHVSAGGFEHVTSDHEQDVSDEVKRCIDSVFGQLNARQTEHRTKAGTIVHRVKFASVHAMHMLHHNLDGLMGGFAHRFIPSKIMNSTEEVAAACLRGMFDGEGTVTNFVTLDMKNVEMLRRAQLLLGRFGIEASISRSGHRLQINSLDSLRLFLVSIGFASGKKQQSLRALIKKHEGKRTPSFQTTTIPNLKSVLSKNRTFVRGDDAGATLLRKYRVKWPTSEVQKRVIEPSDVELLNQVQPELAERVADAMKFRWLKIDSIQAIGPRPVYDISVPATENYVANGIVVHNCWTFVGTKESREAEIINISQIKARNGELFDFSLRAVMNMMQVRSMSDEERDNMQSRVNTQNKNQDRKSNASKEPAYLKDVADD